MPAGLLRPLCLQITIYREQTRVLCGYFSYTRRDRNLAHASTDDRQADTNEFIKLQNKSQTHYINNNTIRPRPRAT